MSVLWFGWGNFARVETNPNICRLVCCKIALISRKYILELCKTTRETKMPDKRNGDVRRFTSCVTCYSCIVCCEHHHMCIFPSTLTLHLWRCEATKSIERDLFGRLSALQQMLKTEKEKPEYRKPISPPQDFLRRMHFMTTVCLFRVYFFIFGVELQSTFFGFSQHFSWLRLKDGNDIKVNLYHWFGALISLLTQCVHSPISTYSS